MLLNNLLVGIALATAFPLGHLLYLWSKDEVDAVVKKFPFLQSMNKFILLLSAATGALSAVFVNKTEVLLILFFANLLAASAAMKDKKQILIPTILFLLAFFVVYLAQKVLKV